MNYISLEDSAHRVAFLTTLIRANTLDSRKSITLLDQEGNIILTTADDAIGFPETIDFRDTQSSGFQLVMALTQQLDATIELMRDKGRNIFTITFQKGER
jgi:two-component sensor histidine kinase